MFFLFFCYFLLNLNLLLSLFQRVLFFLLKKALERGLSLFFFNSAGLQAAGDLDLEREGEGLELEG